MATIQKRGENYRITVCTGYDISGKQIRQTMTYKPEKGLSPTKIKKEVNKIALEFETKVTSGYVMDSNLKLIDFIEIWFKDYVYNKDLSPVTIKGYQDLSVRIVKELGHLKMGKLSHKHVQDFYTNLKNSYSIKGGEKFKATDNFMKIASTMKQKDISIKANIKDDTLRGLKKGGNTTLVVAKKIASALEKDFDTLFIPANKPKKISGETVRHYHRLLNKIMNTAVLWGVIQFNPIEKRVELPKADRENPSYMDDKEAMKLLSMLEKEPIKYKLALNLLIYSGLRRGEIGGLKWTDINFDDHIITINRALKYIPGKGLIEGDPKTAKSKRSMRLPNHIFNLFKTYKVSQAEERIKIGDQWHNTGYIFTRWNGEPMSLDTIGGYLKKFTEKNNLKKVHLHSLRHSNASILIASGIDLKTVSSRLGHSNLSTTSDIYAHVISTADAKASDTLENLLINSSTAL